MAPLLLLGLDVGILSDNRILSHMATKNTINLI
jgi:hypothetical protein